MLYTVLAVALCVKLLKKKKKKPVMFAQFCRCKWETNKETQSWREGILTANEHIASFRSNGRDLCLLILFFSAGSKSLVFPRMHLSGVDEKL